MAKKQYGTSNWHDPTRKITLYDPSDIGAYCGKTFVSKKGSKYRITENGTFSGRPSIEGAEVMLIAGLEKSLYMAVLACLSERDNPKAKSQLDELVFKYGQEPKEGLDLVISLTPSSSKDKGRYGIIIPAIKWIK